MQTSIINANYCDAYMVDKNSSKEFNTALRSPSTKNNPIFPLVHNNTSEAEPQLWLHPSLFLLLAWLNHYIQCHLPLGGTSVEASLL